MKPVGIKNGIDVSKHNDVIEWDVVAHQNIPTIDFAFIRASEGRTNKDPRCHYNATQAKLVGMPIGYYHFATLNDEDELTDAIAEADFFLTTIKDYPLADFPLWLDLEDLNHKVDLDKDEVLAWGNAFIKRLEEKGKWVGTYTGRGFVDMRLPKNHDLGRTELWLAQYNKRLVPVLPVGWKTWWIWQHTDQGKVNGIKGYVDLNRVNQSAV